MVDFCWVFHVWQIYQSHDYYTRKMSFHLHNCTTRWCHVFQFFPSFERSKGCRTRVVLQSFSGSSLQGNVIQKNKKATNVQFKRAGKSPVHAKHHIWDILQHLPSSYMTPGCRSLLNWFHIVTSPVSISLDVDSEY